MNLGIIWLRFKKILKKNKLDPKNDSTKSFVFSSHFDQGSNT
jgi:hypothetical protein